MGESGSSFAVGDLLASVIRTYYLLEKKIHYMKHPGLMQLTVEVGKCTLPPLQYHEYALTVRLSTPPIIQTRNFQLQLLTS